jgi:hypothetical protein
LSVALCPLQIVWLTPAFATGNEFTKTVTKSVAEPQPFVAVKVYVVCAAGEAVGLAIFGLLNPVEGLQLYGPLPLPLSAVLCPLQIVLSAPALAVGTGFTVIDVKLAVLTQEPFEAVTDIVPDVAQVMLTQFVPCPEVILLPAPVTVHA